MKYRIASDIHCEFYSECDILDLSRAALPPMPDDGKTTLLLAGDIGSMHKPLNLGAFLRFVAPRFLQVVYIPGNHEFYSGDLYKTPGRIMEMIADIPNIAFSTLGSFIPKDEARTIHHGTLWSDFDGENPGSMWEAQRRMNDYHLIRNKDKNIVPMDTLELHKLSRDYLEKNVGVGSVVMTHHSPSLQSIPKEYLTDRVNGAYHSDLEPLILRRSPALWCHGHTHTATRYRVGDTEIVCNPRGYGNQHKKNGYDPLLTVEL